MIVTYNRGIQKAELELTSVRALEGRVITEGVIWTIADSVGRTLARSEEARPIFVLEPGQYQLRVAYRGRETAVGPYELQRDTLTNMLILLQEGQAYPSENGYYVDSDPILEYERRVLDRGVQAKWGSATNPIKDPYHQPTGESHLASHPVLAQTAQFDGVEPTVSPEPEQNDLALEKTLTLQHQLTNQPT